MELTWQEIMSITELQVSQVGGNEVVGGGKSSETGSLAGIEALGVRPAPLSPAPPALPTTQG